MKIQEPGTIVHAQIYVHASPYFRDEMLLSAVDIIESGYPLLGVVDISFIMPDKSQKDAMLESIDAQINKAKAEHHLLIESLNDKKQQLLAIGSDK